jgi:hypothetical protein
MKGNMRNKVIEIEPTETVEFLSENRNINEFLIRKLKKSMSKYGVISAITVVKNRKKFIVLDGQHRWTAANELGLTVPAIVINKNNIDAIVDMNTIQKNWTLEDFANFYSENRDETISRNYSELKSLRNETGLHYTSLIKIFETGSGLKPYKSGKFAFSRREFGEIFLTYLDDIEPFIEFCKLARFIDGYTKVASNDKYNHNRMMHKLTLRHGVLLELKGNPSKYAKMLEDIYNYHEKTNGLVRFGNW